jgi:hypothetical protein
MSSVMSSSSLLRKSHIAVLWYVTCVIKSVGDGHAILSLVVSRQVQNAVMCRILRSDVSHSKYKIIICTLFECFYHRQTHVDVPKTGLKPGKDDTENHEWYITIRCQIFVAARLCHTTNSPIPMNRWIILNSCHSVQIYIPIWRCFNWHGSCWLCWYSHWGHGVAGSTCQKLVLVFNEMGGDN